MMKWEYPHFFPYFFSSTPSVFNVRGHPSLFSHPKNYEKLVHITFIPLAPCLCDKFLLHSDTKFVAHKLGFSLYFGANTY